MVIYIAGPMRGYEKYNFPAFTKAAAHLRHLGYTIISPHELDSDQIREEALKSTTGVLEGGKIGGETAGQILGRDVTIVIDKVNAIAFLPGWERSTGAKLEAFVGLLHNFPFFEYDDEDGLTEIPQEYVAGTIIAQWMPKHIKHLAGVIENTHAA